MTIAISHKAIGHLQAAVSPTDTYLEIEKQTFGSFINLQGDSIYAILRSATAREIVRIKIAASVMENKALLKVARGQGGSIAAAWPAGTLLFASTHADLYASIIQAGENRVIDYNPNQVLTPLYAGEKVWQNAPVSRWWKAFNDNDPYWDLITGEPVWGSENYEDIGWDYPLLLSMIPVWEVHFDNTEWEISPNSILGPLGSWNPGSWWDSDNVAGAARIGLKVLGAWAVNYRPTKLRLSFLPDPMEGRLHVSLYAQPGDYFEQIFDSGSVYDLTNSGIEIDIPGSLYGGGSSNIDEFYIDLFYPVDYVPFQLTNLEWFA